MTIVLALDTNRLDVQGEFTLEEIRPVLTQFINAISDTPHALQSLVDRLNAQSDTLQSAIIA